MTDATTSVVISATDSSGVSHDIQLNALGPTAATFLLDQTRYAPLSNIQRLGDQVVCETPVFLSTATIAVTVGPTSVEISVTGVWFAPPPQIYSISAADSAALIAWLQNFPENSTMVFPYKFGMAPPSSFAYKFGRRKMVAPKTCMRFRDYQQLSFPEAPPSGSYRPAASTALAQMYGNDQLGDCVIAWMAHAIGTFTGNAGEETAIFSNDQIVEIYSAIGGYNPADPSTDQGCDENTALDYWLATGFVGHKIAGFVSIDATNPKDCASAVWLFETLMFGVALPQPWPGQATGPGFVWDVAGEPDPNQNHCFGSVSWDEKGLGVETWGMDGSITYEAVAKYAVANAGGQLFSVLTPEILNRATQRAPNGFDFNQLKTDFVGMGGTVTTEVPPNPTLVGKKAS